MNTNEIRQLFLEFFSKRQHQIFPSSCVVPQDDPTLLFTNAGMVQFKDIFLGLAKSPVQRAVTAQLCIRAGGKHNDLDNVGYTARHHTFFEMLGNFSFGDYFKEEAIQFSWDFLTNVLKLPPEKLWITIYQKDSEAESIWLNQIGVDPARLSRCGEEDNFWAMGDTGPCGPCSEIFYDHGPEVPGGPPGSSEAEGDRYTEIWNLVFMQYARDKLGHLSPLPKPSIDTGMGLERIAAVMQGVQSNYDIDLFQILKQTIQDRLQGLPKSNASMNVIADHLRSSAFLIMAGVLPDNEGRGYVLRRIIRRAIRHLNKLALDPLCLDTFFPALLDAMGSAYPELSEKESEVRQVLKRESERFASTLKNGMQLLKEAISNLETKVFSGNIAFKLYDTYGFPVDLTEEILCDEGVTLDWPTFEAALARQRAQSQSHKNFAANYLENIHFDTRFVGYTQLQSQAKIVCLLDADQNRQTRMTERGSLCKIFLDQSPFYPEGGGQIGDTGELIANDLHVIITDTQKQGQSIVHFGYLELGSLSLDLIVEARVKTKARVSTAQNHSATHLLHAALRQLLGIHVTQKGSLVNAERLRFDFSHPEALTRAQLCALDQCVNKKIRENLPVKTELMTPEAAKQKGAMALFSEKYTETVRVLSMGDFSCELCGGTHVLRTGDIGLFKVVSESAVANGVRRIEAVTGQMALDWCLTMENALLVSSQLLKIGADKMVYLPEKIMTLLETKKQLSNTHQNLQIKLASLEAVACLEKLVTTVGGALLIHCDKDRTPHSMRTLLDQLKTKIGSAVIVLISDLGEQIHVLAYVTDSIVRDRAILAKEIVRFLCGRGGGRPQFAQGGGMKAVDFSQKLIALHQNLSAKLEGDVSSQKIS